jgi:hypothetical protein
MSEFRKHGEMLRDERRGSPAIKRQTDAAKKLFATHSEVSMSMVEELKELQAMIRIQGHIDACAIAAFDFLRNHGQALVEAIADAERYRWLRDLAGNDILEELKVKFHPTEFDSTIDLDRTKAGAGGGA